MNAQRFCDEVLPSGRGVPLVVLAGCATALNVTGSQGGTALPGLARQLLARGVPAVLAMQAPVSDPYATDLGARLYRALATFERPDPLAALAEARRTLEVDRQGGKVSALVDLAEWATPALYLRGPSLSLYDPEGLFEDVQPPPEPRFTKGVVVRRVGEFVGRRREERRILQALRNPDGAGVLLHGLGGVGKSSLSAEILKSLSEEGWLIATTFGKISPDDLLAEVGQRLLFQFQKEGVSESRRHYAVEIKRPNIDWEERFRALSENFLGDRPLIVLLDNFEDNFAPGDPAEDGPSFQIQDEDLANLLASWLSQPGGSHLLITSRHPFALPEDAQEILEPFHLGPLSFAETRKLIWRLPSLDALSRDDQLRAYTEVGGHPRALEYLDALLRGGQTRFRDISHRLKGALKKQGIEDPKAWLHDVKGDLDRALAETVTLAVDDVLLGGLLDRLKGVPLAEDLLIGAAVYQVPVDLVGLAWQVGEEVEIAQHQPFQVPDDFGPALEVLFDLGLLAPMEDFYFVHRWTATALLRQYSEKGQEAHHRAARYWRWRVDNVPQGREQDIEEYLQARYHHREEGEIDAAVEVTGWVCLQLDIWGAYRREEQLCREVLHWVSEKSFQAAAFTHQLGLLAQKRGDYEQALEWYQKALPILEELGNRVGMASSYHNLGAIAQDRGDYEQALEWYQKSLRIEEELGNRAGMASIYHQLGIVAQDRGDYEQALDWYQKALPILEELGNRVGMARTISQLGVLATERGNPEEAVPLNLRSLAIRLQIGSPESRIDLFWLNRQRELLGEERFGEILREHLSEEDAVVVLDLMARSSQEGEEQTDSPTQT